MAKGADAVRLSAPEAYSRHRARNIGVLLALCGVLLLAALLGTVGRARSGLDEIERFVAANQAVSKAAKR